MSNSVFQLEKKKNRNSTIELCRILSMIMIVLGHFASHGDFHFEKQMITIPRLWWHVIEMGGNFGVNVFVIISGYYLIDDKQPKVSINKALRLWGELLFYSILIYGLSVALGFNSFSIIEMVKSFFPITSRVWWFATVYFALFLLHPFINHFLLSHSH